MKKIVICTLCLFSFIYGLNAQTLTPTYSNVDYAGKGNSKQMMDIYIPSGTTTPKPVIVHIHGGAFLMGSEGSGEQPSYVNYYNNNFVCVDINYRLSSDSIWPAQVYDCKAAIRFLKAHATQYQIDTCRIGAIGESAGGYLVSILGTTGDVRALEGKHLGNTNVSSRIQAVVDLFGPINFLTMDAEAAALGFTITTNSTTSPESKLMGAAVQTIPARVTSANPTTYISVGDAAFFISAGSVDGNIPYTQGQNFSNALVSVIGSGNASFELLAGAGHGGSVWHTAAQEAKYLAFFNAHLTGCSPSSINSEEQKSEKIIVYPNPVRDFMTINLPADKIFSVQILNTLGQVVYNSDHVANNLEISCSNLLKGVYILKATSGNTVITNKILKQ